MEGIARQFQMDHPELDTKTYDEICEIFAQEFTRKRKTTTTKLQQVVQLPKETTKNYYARFMREAQPAFEAGIEDNDLTVPEKELSRKARMQTINGLAFPIFVQGLRPELREAVVRERAETVDTAKDIAKNHEQYLESYGPMLRKMHLVSCLDEEKVNQVTFAQPNLTDAKQQLNTFNERGNKRQNFASNPQPRTNRQQNDMVCFYCKKAGHIKRECQKLKRRIQESEEGTRFRQGNYLREERPYNGRVGTKNTSGQQERFFRRDRDDRREKRERSESSSSPSRREGRNYQPNVSANFEEEPNVRTNRRRSRSYEKTRIRAVPKSDDFTYSDNDEGSRPSSTERTRRKSRSVERKGSTYSKNMPTAQRM
jgi:hypothetical protein